MRYYTDTENAQLIKMLALRQLLWYNAQEIHTQWVSSMVHR